MQMMNSEAAKLGMKESEFHSPHGLPPAVGQLPDLVSPHDMAILGRALITEFPNILTITSLEEAGFRGGEFKMSNHNHLLKHFPGCDGLKTGYYNQAGFCVTATAKRNDSRVIAVLMGCARRPERDAEAAKLLAKGLSAFSTKKIIGKGVSFGSKVLVEGGTKDTVEVVAAGDVVVSIPSGEETKVVTKLELCQSLKAPIEVGASCGTAKFMLAEREIAEVAAVTAEPVPSGGASAKIKNLIGW